MKLIIFLFLLNFSNLSFASSLDIPDGSFEGIVTAIEDEVCSIKIDKRNPAYTKNEMSYAVTVSYSDKLKLSFILVKYNNKLVDDNNDTIISFENLEENKSNYKLELKYNTEDILYYKLSSLDNDMLITCRNLQ